MFEDTVNRANPIAGRINMSNLCSEILQVNSAVHL
jgi:ribonucleoside-diphosphate reductase alpha chain